MDVIRAAPEGGASESEDDLVDGVSRTKDELEQDGNVREQAHLGERS